MGMTNLWNRLRGEEGEASSGGGIGFAGLLTIAFIVLKLTGYIHWSWVWVLSPLWISLAFVLVLIAVFLLGVGIYKLVT